MPQRRLGPRLSLLIIEPDEAIRAWLADAARDAGLFWSIDVMASGRWALDYMTERLKDEDSVIPDMVIMNAQLGEMQAEQLIEQFRLYKEFQDVFLAVLAAQADPWEHNTAESAGCDYYLQRPKTAPELIALLRQLSEASATKSRPYRAMLR